MISIRYLYTESHKPQILITIKTAINCAFWRFIRDLMSKRKMLSVTASVLLMTEFGSFFIIFPPQPRCYSKWKLNIVISNPDVVMATTPPPVMDERACLITWADKKTVTHFFLGFPQFPEGVCMNDRSVEISCHYSPFWFVIPLRSFVLMKPWLTSESSVCQSDTQPSGVLDTHYTDCNLEDFSLYWVSVKQITAHGITRVRYVLSIHYSLLVDSEATSDRNIIRVINISGSSG